MQEALHKRLQCTSACPTRNLRLCLQKSNYNAMNNLEVNVEATQSSSQFMNLIRYDHEHIHNLWIMWTHNGVVALMFVI